MIFVSRVDIRNSSNLKIVHFCSLVDWSKCDNASSNGPQINAVFVKSNIFMFSCQLFLLFAFMFPAVTLHDAVEEDSKM